MYGHENLQDGQIRLLILKPAQDDKTDISVEIRRFTLKRYKMTMSSPPYRTTGEMEKPISGCIFISRVRHFKRNVAAVYTWTRLHSVPCTKSVLKSGSTSSQTSAEPCDHCDRGKMTLCYGLTRYAVLSSFPLRKPLMLLRYPHTICRNLARPRHLI